MFFVTAKEFYNIMVSLVGFCRTTFEQIKNAYSEMQPSKNTIRILAIIPFVNALFIQMKYQQFYYQASILKEYTTLHDDFKKFSTECSDFSVLSSVTFVALSILVNNSVLLQASAFNMLLTCYHFFSEAELLKYILLKERAVLIRQGARVNQRSIGS